MPLAGDAVAPEAPEVPELLDGADWVEGMVVAGGVTWAVGALDMVKKSRVHQLAKYLPGEPAMFERRSVPFVGVAAPLGTVGENVA